MERHARANQISDRVLDTEFTYGDDPVVEPVTLAEVKAYANIDYPDWDALIEQTMIIAAREWVETYCGVSVISRFVKALISVYVSQELPYGPVKNLQTIIVKDEQGNTVTAPTLRGLNFVHLMDRGVYTVEYEAGFVSVPKAIKQGICAKVLAGFENRGDKVVNDYDAIARALVKPYTRKL